MRGALRLALLLLLAAVPAAADRLVTKAGGQVETRGPWQVKGKLVVFTQADGTLGSVRLADVDLPASEQATAAAQAAQEAPPPPASAKPPERRKSVRSLTDADFSRKTGLDEKKGEDAQAGKDKDIDKGKDKDKAGDDKSPIVVSSWTKAERPEKDGLELTGTLQNSGQDLASDIVLKVKLYNEAQEVVATAGGVLGSTSIPGGGSTSFRVPFPGVFTFARAEFEMSSRAIIITSPATTKP